jgi:hypothetical protein
MANHTPSPITSGEALKPCPFCDSEVAITYDQEKCPFITCEYCRVEIPAYRPGFEHMLITAWNRRTASAASAPVAQSERDAWISVDDHLPKCVHECTTSGTDISNTVLVFGMSAAGMNGTGFGHLQDDGKWVCYEGEYDEMNVVTPTHWRPLFRPDVAAQQPAERGDA